MIVMKFGGTSVEDAAAIRRVGGIVRGRLERRPVVVVSALARVTDQLLAAGRASAAGDHLLARELLQRLRERHFDTACDLVPNASLIELRARLSAYFAELEQLLRGLYRALPPRETDALMAYGELLSSTIVSAALATSGIASVWVDARQCIVTNAEHTRAVPEFAASKQRLAAMVGPHVEAGAVPVLGGFIASTGDGVTTTLGRGGSDFSAAIVGAALGVEGIEIWTDVPGIMTTDPALCPSARLIPEMTFAEAAEIAYFGAKVLHPGTLLPAVENNIPVHVLNSREPGGAGTRIAESAARGPSVFRAIAARKNVTILNVAARRVWSTRGFLRSVFAVFDRHNCPVDVMATTQSSLSLAVDSSEAIAAIVADLEEHAHVSCEPGHAIVCLVGEKIRGKPGIAASVFSAVAGAGINVRMISQGASEIGISFIISARDVPDAVRRLHSEFFRFPGAEPTILRTQRGSFRAWGLYARNLDGEPVMEEEEAMALEPPREDELEQEQI